MSSDYNHTGSTRSTHRAMQMSAHLYGKGIRANQFRGMHPTERDSHAVQAGMMKPLTGQEWDLVGRGLEISEENDQRFKSTDQGGAGEDPFAGL
jgi:hypothetical protein